MEALVGRNNDRLGNTPVASVSAGQLNGGLVAFSPTVTKENLLCNGILREPVCERCLCGDQVEVAAVMDGLHLLGHGGRELRVGVTECACGDARYAVQIFLAICCVELATFAVLDGEWESPAEGGG